MIRRAAAILLALFAAPLWLAGASGAVEVRACVPAGAPLLGAELHLLRPAPACPSGQAFGDGAFVVAGTVGLLALLAGLVSIAALVGVGPILGRLGALVGRLVEAILPWRRAVRSVLIAPTTPARPAALARVPRATRWWHAGSVARRGPPALA